MTIRQLFPAAGERPLTNLYLDHNLRDLARQQARPFVYANFVMSLDGRIAVTHPSKPGFAIPKNVANKRDWRLFQELAAQADVILTTGRYLRDWADGRAQEILAVDDPEYADLRAWRANHGLPPQPDLAILSATLDFPIPPILTANGRRVLVFTPANPDPIRAAEIEAEAGALSQTGSLFEAGEGRVSAREMIRILGELNYQTVYSAAGPKVLHTLLADQMLNRLYLTQVGRLLGGQPFASILEGELLAAAVDAQLATVYHDAEALDGLGQLLLAYDIVATK